MSDIQCMRNELHALLKMDYGIEIYNMNENIIRLSFFHLNSFYNAFCTTLISENGCNPSFNWQYARINKAVEKRVLRLINAVYSLQARHKTELIENEFAYYKTLSDQVFNAKYTTAVMLHTVNE